MIHKLILKNFKKIKEETFHFNNFDLIVGANNSGKSTALQALAIWQFCVDTFTQVKKAGSSSGIMVVLPNFTALPLPEFNLLWTNRLGTAANKYIYIEIDVYWKDEQNMEQNFCVQIRYQAPQSVYAIPKEGWSNFTEKYALISFPHIVYVPPFSGLNTSEILFDDGNVRQYVGKAQPGSVLRNLLYRVINHDDNPKENPNWKAIKTIIKEWFNVELQLPQYEKNISTEIKLEYKVTESKKTFDIIAGGSGFHQILTLLAFMYGYKNATTILFDEPDAHLHANLQRQILNYIKKHSEIQFLIATHSEEFIKNIEVSSIISILQGKPIRVPNNSAIISAMSIIDNNDIVRTQSSSYILYVEGEDDQRILSSWANTLGKTGIYQKFYPYILGGTSKDEMRKKAKSHFEALQQIVPTVKRAIILDKDEVAIDPPEDQFVLNEWKRKNIDNYLLVPDAWKRAVAKEARYNENDLFFQPYKEVIDNTFEEQNLTLPKNSTWRNLKAQIFSVVDGKKLLFENQDSLFNKIKDVGNLPIKINRSAIASAMTAEEIHEDVLKFFDNLKKIVETESV